MIRSSRLLLTTASLALCAVLSLAQGRSLYLVTGNAGGVPVASALFKLDTAKHAVTLATTLVEFTDRNGGIDFILADHERRVLVAGATYGRPDRAVILRMDNPQHPRSRPIDVDGVSIPSLFGGPGGGLWLALDIYHDDGSRLKGLDLLANDATVEMKDLPWTDYAYRRTEGSWAPGDVLVFNGSFVLEPKGGGSMQVRRGGRLLDAGIKLPNEISMDADKKLSVAVNTDALLVVDRLNERGNGPQSPAGRTLLSILDKKSDKWRTEIFPGGGSSVRAFGSWVAVNESEIRRDLSGNTVKTGPDPNLKVSPGGNARQNPLNPGSSEVLPVDHLFQASHDYFPGTMHLFDAQTGQKYRIDTAQGDSEILLVDETSVYYRVNNVLYRADIAKGKPNLQGVEIARDDRIQLAHWAFFGP